MIDYLRIGIPGIFSMAEWWFWEIVTFLTGLLGKESLAAHTICCTIMPFMFMIPLGIG